MYFAHKHLETGPNYSHEIPNFLKYHMGLNLTRDYDKFIRFATQKGKSCADTNRATFRLLVGQTE